MRTVKRPAGPPYLHSLFLRLQLAHDGVGLLDELVDALGQAFGGLGLHHRVLLPPSQHHHLLQVLQVLGHRRITTLTFWTQYYIKLT